VAPSTTSAEHRRWPSLGTTQDFSRPAFAVRFATAGITQKGKGDTAKVVTDPRPPELESLQSSENQVTDHGNGRWNRDSSYRFNAGCNPHHGKAPEKGNVGIMTQDDALKLENWFQKRYPDAKPQVLKEAGKWNLVLVRNLCVYNFHITVK
jgi:hypothetical protein